MIYIYIYDTLLTPAIKELSMKKITMHLYDQNYKSQLNLILFFEFDQEIIDYKIKQEKRWTFQQSRLLVVRDRPMNPSQ